VCRTSLSDQLSHVPKPEAPLFAETPDIISVLYVASPGHKFLFLCCLMLDHTLEMAIAEKSNVLIFMAQHYREKRIIIAHSQNLSIAPPRFGALDKGKLSVLR